MRLQGLYLCLSPDAARTRVVNTGRSVWYVAAPDYLPFPTRAQDSVETVKVQIFHQALRTAYRQQYGRAPRPTVEPWNYLDVPRYFGTIRLRTDAQQQAMWQAGSLAVKASNKIAFKGGRRRLLRRRLADPSGCGEVHGERLQRGQPVRLGGPCPGGDDGHGARG